MSKSKPHPWSVVKHQSALYVDFNHIVAANATIVATVHDIFNAEQEEANAKAKGETV